MQRRGLIVDDEPAHESAALTLNEAIMASGSVVRILGGNQIQLHQLTVPDSERLQEFLLPLIPFE
jgi:hypothetical protein